MLDDEFNDAMQDKVKIIHETVASSYQALLQIDWTPDMLQEHVTIASSSSSELKDEDDEFFDQEPPKDNQAFMKLIWKGIKKHIKMKKGKKKNNDEPHIKRHVQRVVVAKAKEGDTYDGEL